MAECEGTLTPVKEQAAWIAGVSQMERTSIRGAPDNRSLTNQMTVKYRFHRFL